MFILFSVKHCPALSQISGGWRSKERKPVSGSVFARLHLIKFSFSGETWCGPGDVVLRKMT